MKKSNICCRGIIRHGTKILLVRHHRDGKPLPYMALPGGGLDAGETLKECLARELKEELGVTAKIGDLVAVQQLGSGIGFFFEIANPQDFTKVDFSDATHAFELTEIAWVDVVNDTETKVLPTWLKEVVQKMEQGKSSQVLYEDEVSV